jgi:hypothetical protein
VGKEGQDWGELSAVNRILACLLRRLIRQSGQKWGEQRPGKHGVHSQEEEGKSSQ